MLDQESVRKIVREYSDEVRKLLSPTRIILFGSYVNGKPNELSDIDVAVLVKGYKADWNSMLTKLYGLKWYDDFTDIEPHLLDEEYDHSDFINHVINSGEVVYQAV
ncbi:MAG: nucleotidyltransferase domain-containing protein [Oscillospiraceae bacterium]|jgi:predicted nucleotidyltransferase|nr:nucleotidyltransferase domain-containing protein [Oscillospiraceae bacterium]